ncbi:MAG: class I SAM-dependent RNA methyltransferase [Deltaproteobacteria bacterium]|nr:class I SAM-dependent RNA methyltransferase [Deltaproteobacteria bacterium]
MSAAPVLLEITRLAKLGEGVALDGGRAVFVPGALPGEQVRAEVSEQDGVLRARVLERLRDAPERRPAPCPVADRCGGCDWQHLAGPAQLRARVEIVQSTLQHLGRIAPASYTLHAPVPAPAPLAYRRRAVFHFFKEAGRFQLGLFERGSHRGVALAACPALVPALERWLPEVAEQLAPVAADISAVHLLAEGEARALALELKGPVKPRLREQAERLLRATGASGAVLLPASGQPAVLGKPILQGAAPLRPGVPLFHRPDGFAQANAGANEALVRAAVEALVGTGGGAGQALELYSGNGNFSFALAARVHALTAVETSPVGVELAQRAAHVGGLDNVRFVQGDALKVARGLAGEGRRFPLLLVDPPRTGAPGLAAVADALEVERLVYVACDPAALARDAADLVKAGFAPQALQVVDMFPQTHHAEAVMSFARAGAGG